MDNARRIKYVYKSSFPAKCLLETLFSVLQMKQVRVIPSKRSVQCIEFFKTVRLTSRCCDVVLRSAH
jgi:hypothetical protein